MDLQHTLRFFDGDSRSSSVSMGPGAGFCGSAASLFSLVGSTAMRSAPVDGCDDIFFVFTATRFLACALVIRSCETYGERVTN